MNQIKTQLRKERRRRPRKGQRGLTLIEILVVVAILGLIAGVVGISVSGAFSDTQIDAAKVQVGNISDALEVYKFKNQRYPTTAEGLRPLEAPPGGKTPVMETVPDDPWGAPYLYVSPGQHNRGKFDLSSKGPDGQSGTDDDISNWKKENS